MQITRRLWLWISLALAGGGGAAFALRARPGRVNVWSLSATLAESLAVSAIAYAINFAVIGVPAIKAGVPTSRVLRVVTIPALLGFLGGTSAARLGFAGAFALVVFVSGAGSLHELFCRAPVWVWALHVACIIVAGLGVGLVTRRFLSKRFPGRRGMNIAVLAAVLNLTYWLLVGLGFGLWIAVGLWRYRPEKACPPAEATVTTAAAVVIVALSSA